MKTIRTNCFETNSSSTHSITIVSKNQLKNQKGSKSVLEDNILKPGNLQSSPAFVSDQYRDKELFTVQRWSHALVPAVVSFTRDIVKGLKRMHDVEFSSEIFPMIKPELEEHGYTDEQFAEIEKQVTEYLNENNPN